MPSTYTLISGSTLASSAASYTFSSIPATYTELMLSVSTRDDYYGDYRNQIRITFNGSSTAVYSDTLLYAFFGSATVGSTRESSQAFIGGSYSDASTATANTFNSTEYYIPSYTASQNKPVSITGGTENNVANDLAMSATAGLWRDTTAINSITLTPFSANFVTGSSFYLYGIKSS